MLWHWLPRKSSSAIFPWTAFCFPPFLAKCCCQSTLDLCAQSPPNMEMESTHQYLFHTKHKSLTLVLRFWRWKTIYWRITNHWYRFAFGKTLSRFANSSIDKSELYRSFFLPPIIKGSCASFFGWQSSTWLWLIALYSFSKEAHKKKHKISIRAQV